MAITRYQTATCYVHAGPPIDTRLLHEHHKHPKGYGGGDERDNLVWLCGSCHDLVHRLAHYFKSGKTGLVSDLAQEYQAAQNLSPAARHRLLELAQLVAKSMDSFVPEEFENMEQEDTVLVQIPLPRSIHLQAKHLAAQYKNPGGKRQMGLYRYLSKVLVNHVRMVSGAPMRAKDPARAFGALAPEPDDAPEIEEAGTKQGDLIPFE
jgi:hypothetical protein